VFDPSSILEPLNERQREAVTHGDGPLLVVAGPGSGKTLTLASRVAWLVHGGTPPARILLLTFTRRAAGEMLTRAERITGLATGRVWGGTFHALGNRLLRRFGRAAGLKADFTVMDQSDAADLLNLLREELGFAERKRRFPRKETLAAIYSRTVNAERALPQVLEAEFPWCAPEAEGIRSIFARYTDRKRERGVLDYDDLLLYWRAIASDGGSAARRLAGMFDHVLVDEYQDTNSLQADILSAMTAGTSNATVVGDDAQAIYSFRSATVRNILEFPERFPGTRVVKLEHNYRSTQPILDATNAIIALSPKCHDKTMFSSRPGAARPALITCLDEAQQCDEACARILEHREQGVPLRRQAVLFRAAHHSDLLEIELARRNIPFVKYGGLKFLEAAHVKDALAVLRILENPLDEVSWFRVLQLLNGVGPATARRLMEQLGVADPTSGPDGGPLARIGAGRIDLPDPARVDGAALRELVKELYQRRDDRPVGAQIERLRRFLEPILRRIYPSADSRIRDLEQLELIAGGYASRSRFLADLALDPPTSTGDLAGPPLLDEDYVILSTIHSAKGCEWDVVHVIHAADGMIPSDMATGNAEEIEEERRLFYVAATRARDMLYVYFPLRYHRRPRGHEDEHSYAQLTRFLPKEVRSLFDEGTAYLDREEAILPAEAGGAAAEQVDAFLAGLWGS
jgi:ATP-dependent DNA helicase UvrD/PcrA